VKLIREEAANINYCSCALIRFRESCLVVFHL
jgi:hypothetical protein